MERYGVARFGVCVFALIALLVWSSSSGPVRSAAAQAPGTLEDVTADGATAPAGNAAGASDDGSRSLLDMLLASGIIGLIIFLLSMTAVGFIIEHAISIRKTKLMPEHVLGTLEQMIDQGEIDQAIEYCNLSENHSLASDVILAGLERYKGSDFGFAEYKTAVEEAGEDHTGRLYRKTEVLGVIGAIAPMLGLLGTVQGMISAFNTIASKQGMARPDELAGGISLALITTFEGLIVAIPAMVAFSFFRNKIDSLVAEAGKRVERLMMPLGRKR
jgi:biopolymer transport protein ExbB